MKKTLPLVALLAIASLATRAQTAPPAHHADTTTAVARHRAEHYTGPKVVADSKELGQKFRQHSKPSDARIPRANSLPK